MKLRKLRGFTLVELLVVIAIIGVLAGLLIPAVMFARTRAYSAQLQNRVKRVNDAVIKYETQKQQFPPSYRTFPHASGTATWSWVPHIMPFIDQDAAYKKLAKNPGDASAVTYNELLDSPMSNKDKVPGTLCLVVNMGRPDDANGESAGYGIFVNYNKPNPGKVNQSKIKDGSTNTIVMSHNIQAQPWQNISVTATGPDESYHGLLWLPQTTWPIAPNQDVDGLTNISHARPSTRIPGIFIAGMADSSVRSISEQIDYSVYARLMTPDGAKAAANLTAEGNAAAAAIQQVPLSSGEF
ncbi:MAG: DUF1559 domain-containing protein [bacterium]|nr:DUF1559 domain-containing protein [bacterium]